MNYCPFCMNEIPDGSMSCPSCGKDPSDYVSKPHTLSLGAVLNHRYRVGGVLGEGGFGITYIGLDTLLMVRVAIKEFYPAGMVNRNNTASNEVQSISTESAMELFSKSREHFLHEARTLAKFTNEKGVVAVRDFFEENHTVYIVMEYLDGITLKEYLKQVGTISSYNTICLLMPILGALKKIHEKNLIHRDISPDNIMLVGEDVKLLDFGAAREFADEKSLSVMLKHGYAPMEQYRRHGKQGAWTDIYAICATIYKCITGSIPPDAPDRIYEDNLKMPSELGFESTPEFDEVLRHGLAIKAEDRIQSIDRLLAEIAAVPGFDIDFDDSTAKTAGRPVPVSVSSGNEEERLSQYVPRGSYEDEAGTKPQTASEKPAESGNAADEDYRDRRLSEYISSRKTGKDVSHEQTPEPAKKDEIPQNAAEGSKKKSPLPIIIAAAAVVLAAVIGIIIFSGKNKSEKSGNNKEDTAKNEVSVTDEAKPTSIIGEEEKNTPTPTAEPVVTSPAPTEAAVSVSPTESPHMHIIYPNLGGNFDVEDGLLTMNSAIFSMKKTSIQLLFGTGTLYVTEQHDRWEKGQTVMLVPIDLGVYEEDYFDSVDLYFMDDTLYNAQFECGDAFDPAIKEKATKKFGQPYYENGDDVRWALKDRDCLFRLYVQDYEGEKIFTQSYIYKDMAYKEGMVEEGFFE